MGRQKPSAAPFVVTFYRTIEEDNDSLGGTPQATPQAKILSFCSEPHSKVEIAEHCGYKDIKYFARQYLTPMLASGQLLMTIPDKPTHPEQRYVAARKNECNGQ